MADCYHLVCVVGYSVALSRSTHIMNRVDMNIYVGNLPYGVTEEELKATFSEFGAVVSVNMITDKFTGQSKGFAFVEMSNNSEADQAIKALNDSTLKGRKIKVNQAKPRSERPARRPRY